MSKLEKLLKTFTINVSFLIGSILEEVHGFARFKFDSLRDITIVRSSEQSLGKPLLTIRI
jgi:hypothetical protein